MCLETERTCRQWIIHKGAAFYHPLRDAAFHRIPVQVISHQWVGQYHPAALFQSVRCPKARHPCKGERIVTTLPKWQSSPAGYRVSR